MYQIPNIAVASAANRYLEAADLIDSRGTGGELSWVACINAALAVEIYLKSFLAQQVFTDVGSNISLITQKSVKGHNLLELYNKIDSDIQAIMLAQSRDIDPSLELESLIVKCKDYFFYARYPYEKESIKCLSTDVILLAKHMRALTRRVVGIKHK